MLKLPRVRAAAVQATPVHPDAGAMVDKVVSPLEMPLIDDEGTVYADLDRCVQPKQMHGIVGHHNRFDIFDLKISQRPLVPLGRITDGAAGDDGARASGGLVVGMTVRAAAMD